ncbi:c-type cytochrome biogenesis protein CcsB [Cellulomonas sp. PhB143]|uniref:c-type cytochrome biogenesis protein CcsB n=1 Tax=Cellulomonas sp. PhB143 TaxID=2485186 RepID=UPI000F497BDF|nr:c-type cytochrome biogenesis protein CcsB [Cellulomonas sp. PhB143]ROS76689.1 cytochrome c-type biogenesis protein CcsB [Cellulomonas sp. PhB143]
MTSDLSTMLVWGAATALAIALVSFAWDLAALSGRVVEARDAARAATLDATQKGAPVPAGAKTSDAALAAGAGGGSVAVRAKAPAAPARSDGPGLPAAPDGGRRRSRAAGIAMATTTLAWAFLLVAIVVRGIEAGRAPWANMYEFTLVGSFVALSVFLGVNLRRDVRFLGVFVTGLATLFLVFAQVRLYVVAEGVQPALQSYWLVIHVGVALTATGIFTVAFVTSVLQLLRDSRDNGSAVLNRRGWAWLDTTPGATQLEVLSFRLNAVAFVLWTFTVIGGAIWAEHAWGRYWGWDPKEVWSFVVWVVFAAYLHARTTRGWSGRRAAYFVIVGYACVLFNFTGVNLIFNGLHSYAGLPQDN